MVKRRCCCERTAQFNVEIFERAQHKWFGPSTISSREPNKHKISTFYWFPSSSYFYAIIIPSIQQHKNNKIKVSPLTKKGNHLFIYFMKNFIILCVCIFFLYHQDGETSGRDVTAGKMGKSLCGVQRIRLPPPFFFVFVFVLLLWDAEFFISLNSERKNVEKKRAIFSKPADNQQSSINWLDEHQTTKEEMFNFLFKNKFSY